MRVKITKIAAQPNGLPPLSWDKCIPGQAQDLNHSLPIDYTIEGILLNPIRVDDPCNVYRENRNGVREPGHFKTSKVTAVEKDRFYTENSVYIIEYLDES